MEKEFIPYEQALALKELGFNSRYHTDEIKFVQQCFGGYSEKGKICYLPTHTAYREVDAPTYSQAFRWFREKYHIIGEVKFKGGKTTKTAWYDYVIYSEIDWDDENPNEQWKKHEEAELECLKKLIEIVKEK